MVCAYTVCMVKEMMMNTTETSLVEAIRIAMDAYNTLKLRWVNDHATENGFDAWFTALVVK